MDLGFCCCAKSYSNHAEMLPDVEHEKLFEMFPFLCVSLNFSISRDGSLNIPPRWHQMLQPSLFSIPFPKFEGNLRLSVENQEKRAELLNSLSLLMLRSEVKNRPSSNGLAWFLRDESGSSEGLVWLKARGVLVISIVDRKLGFGWRYWLIQLARNVSSLDIIYPCFWESIRRRREYYLSIKIKN